MIAQLNVLGGPAAVHEDTVDDAARAARLR
jgi:hypothetical protein